jgi:hypothetical protein
MNRDDGQRWLDSLDNYAYPINAAAALRFQVNFRLAERLVSGLRGAHRRLAHHQVNGQDQQRQHREHPVDVVEGQNRRKRHLRHRHQSASRAIAGARFSKPA